MLAHYRTRPADLQMMLDREDISVYAMRYRGHIIASAWAVREGGLDDELSTAIYNLVNALERLAVIETLV